MVAKVIYKLKKIFKILTKLRLGVFFGHFIKVSDFGYFYSKTLEYFKNFGISIRFGFITIIKPITKILAQVSIKLIVFSFSHNKITL
jgi:hypothetical protein